METTGTILVVDDEVNIRFGLQGVFEKAGHRVLLAESVPEAIAKLQQTEVDVVLTDVRMADSNGLELLTHVNSHFPLTSVIVMTAYGTIEAAVSAIKQGAYDYIAKPFDLKKLRILLHNCLERQRILQENQQLKHDQSARNKTEAIIGRHATMQAVMEIVRQVAPSEATVLIQGESGTGKEMIAQAIYRLSNRAGAPFVSLNCGSLPQSLTESELFGYEKGAFTGAHKRKLGKIEIADSGTLFLDEIGCMPLESQSNLLRVLERQEVARIGGTVRHVDVRFVAATNIELRSAIKNGLFREDLYYRLNVVPVYIPPLRERADDVPLLLSHYLKSFCIRHKKSLSSFTAEAIAALLEYSWPGNVRELRNLVERLVVTCEREQYGFADLPAEITDSLVIKEPRNEESPPEARKVRDMEVVLIRQALSHCDGHRQKTADMLGISLRSLMYKLKKYHLN